MHSQYQYNNLICQLMAIFDQALYRFITQKPIDLNKFITNFDRKYKKMKELQQKFMYVNNQRVTNGLRRTSEILKEINQNKRNVNTLNSVNNQSEYPLKQQYIPKTNILKTNIPKTDIPKTDIPKANTSNMKNPVMEEEYTMKNSISAKKSHTSTHNRNNISNAENNSKFVIAFQNGRPKTGFNKLSEGNNISKQFQRSVSVNNKTISYERRTQSNDMTSLLNKRRKGKYDSLELENNRKPLYDELQQISKPQDISQYKIKLPSKRSLSSRRWTYKPKQLL